MDFLKLLKALLVEEDGLSEEKAEKLIEDFPGVVAKGMTVGNMALRGTAMALQMADAEADRNRHDE